MGKPNEVSVICFSTFLLLVLDFFFMELSHFTSDDYTVQ
jgi:hypothetical protein